MLTPALPASWTRFVVWLLALTLVGAGCRKQSPQQVSLDRQTSPKPIDSGSQASDPDRLLPTVSGGRFQTDPATVAATVQEWPSEAFATSVDRQLSELKQSTLDGSGADTLWGRLFDPGFQLLADRGRPMELLNQPALQVRRAAPIRLDPPLAGSLAIEQFTRRFSVPGSPADGQRLLLMKVVHVSLDPARGLAKRPPIGSTRIRVEASSRGPRSATQRISLWECVWTGDLDRPTILSAELLSWEEVDRRGPRWFADATQSAVGRTAAFRQQLAFGLQHWLARVETAHGMNYFSKHGLSVADINGDGLEDLYVCQPGGLPNRLFLQQPDGSTREHAGPLGLDLLDRTASALFVDLDNDGDQDAALATLMGVLLYEQTDDGTFQLRQHVPSPDIDLQGLSAVDYDSDGDLDIYETVDFASEVTRARQGLPLFLYHDARDGGQNRLLRNDVRGSHVWQFTDVTREVGLAKNNHRHTLAAAWEDYDNDGDQDLYVANDYGPNSLYRNDDGYFVDIAAEVGVLDFGSGMSVSWGDYDRDGRMDLYVGNMFSSAGNRIVGQDHFLRGVGEARKRIYRRFAKGNSLFRNVQDRFEEVGSAAQVEMGRWAWSSLFADVDRDGWEDLLVANGYMTTSDTGDL